MNKLSVFALGLLMSVLACNYRHEEKQVVRFNKSFDLRTEDVAYIIVRNNEVEFEIRDKQTLDSLTKRIQNARLEYIKFGAKSTFTIFDSSNTQILRASYKGNRFKVEGVVFRCNEELFDLE